MTKSKRCPDCGKTKPLAEWSKNKREPDGLSHYCKACKSVRASTSRNVNHDANILRDRARNLSPQRVAWRKARDTKNREQLRNAHRAWMAAHPNYESDRRANSPKQIEYERRRRAENPELFLQRGRDARARNPGAARRARHKRRASVASSGHIPYSSIQLLQKIDYWGWKCWICSKPVTPGTYQLDHVKPINKGGMDCLSNIRPACESCNKSKQDRWPFQPLWRSSA